LIAEEFRVVAVVYVAVLAPLIIYILNKNKIPDWVPSFYIVGVIVCALGWELWFTYGWIDGDPVDNRRSEFLNNWLPKNINWLLNSMADAGTVLIGGVWLMWISHKKNSKVFTQWNWSAFCILMIWCIGQNVLVEMFLYHDQLAEDKSLSWAPLSPFGSYFNPLLFEFNSRTIMLQTQIPWMILPWFIYRTLINLNRL
tara:strand:+ start:57008 stop:57601 length:594 start_codon:yes stop_codon:yes gene_type:complete